MKPSTSYQPSTSIAILCVGVPGSGKTTIMFSFPRPGILDCDLNLNSAVRVAPQKTFFYAQPSVLSTPEEADFVNKCIPGSTLSLTPGCEVPSDRRWLVAIKETKALLLNPQVETVCVDGLTVLSRWLLDYCEAELVRAGINVKKEYLSKFQSFITLMTGYVSLLRTAKKLVFVTCHQTADQNDLTKAWYYNLAIPGQLKDTLGGLFTDVWGTSATVAGDKVSYWINTRPTNLHVALKTSFDLQPKYDVTGFPPDKIWSLLQPKLAYHATTQT
jgi:hypothetical protein